jgi:hypothetical protein
MFTFPIVAVRKVIDRGTADAAINGGFRNPYYGMKPGEGEIPGLWLVGDQGVYIMSNGKLPDGGRPLVVYSEECHPVGNPDWFDYKHRHFGGDDGIEFIDAEACSRCSIGICAARISMCSSPSTRSRSP